MAPRFSSLELLIAQDDSQILNAQRLKKLLFNRRLRPLIFGWIALLFSSIPGTFLVFILQSTTDSSQVPPAINLGLIAFTGIPFLFLIFAAILIWRQIWTDPIYKYLNRPHEFTLAKGIIVGGECVWDSEHRRQSSVWKAKVEYTIENSKYFMFEDFAKELALTKNVDTKKELKGLSSLLPIEVWILHYKKLHPNKHRSNTEFKNINLISDIKALIQNTWNGEKATIVALDKEKIQQVAKPLLKTNSDLYLGLGSVVFSLIALFFFTLPGIPDGRLLEVEKQLPMMNSIKQTCSELAASLKSTPHLPTGIEQILHLLNDPKLKQLQFDIWNLDFANVPESQVDSIRNVLFENCRETILIDYALPRKNEPIVQKAILYWLDDIAKSPRSVARIQMARTLSHELANKFASASELNALKRWNEKYSELNPIEFQNMNKLIQWISNLGREFAEWQYPFQGRIHQENILNEK